MRLSLSIARVQLTMCLGEETGAKKQKTAKKVKIALGPDGLPI